MADILAQIIATKRTEVAAAKARRPLADVTAAANAMPPARSFLAALAPGRGPRIIAECKQRSPSRGQMVKDYDPAALAKAYERGGAAAISVLTDGPYFGGELAHLTAVRAAVGIPVLRKDFVIDAYQIYEGRAAGADTFLLISGVLSTREMQDLLGVGRDLGMEPLIESHTDEELALALATDGRIFGINNRDLKTFGIDLKTSSGLAARMRGRDPPAIMVCESGIKTAEDVRTMMGTGYGAFLVGESVATARDPESAVSLLANHKMSP